MSRTWNPTTLPDNDNIEGNHYAYCVRLRQPLFMQTGRMIAYYPAPGGPGIKFEPLTAASVGAWVATRFSSPLYSRDWVVADGQGHLILGDRGYDINSYDLDNGNLVFTTDFRSVYAGLIRDCLKADPSPVLRGSFAPVALF